MCCMICLCCASKYVHAGSSDVLNSYRILRDAGISGSVEQHDTHGLLNGLLLLFDAP